MRTLLWGALLVFVVTITSMISIVMHVLEIVIGGSKVYKFLDKLTSMLAIDILAFCNDTCPIEGVVKQYLNASLEGIIDSFNSQFKD